jgi:hypothetical protein
MLTVIFDLQDVESMSIDLPVSLRAICGKSRYFYKTVFSGILPLKSKIRINVIPSPGFKLVIQSFKYFPIVFVSQIPTHFASFFLNAQNCSNLPLSDPFTHGRGKSRYFYKTVFSGILPLKSKIRINVIPSPGFKLVILFGLRDDSWVFLNVSTYVLSKKL